MVYIFAFVGFMMGFGIGLGAINVLLRHRSKQEIKEDKSLRLYGLIAWLLAVMGAIIGVWIHNYNFL